MDQHDQAWPALLKSCGALIQQSQWQSACLIAQSLGQKVSRDTAKRYFEQHFQPWRAVNPDGTTHGLITGYYEPLIKGSLQASAQYAWPIHARPRDMLAVELNDLYPELRNKRVRGRQVGDKVVPYWTRGEINKMGTRLPADILAWAEDPIDLFFLQVQGSGQLELPNGQRMRIGYADQNGHPYQSIGRWLVAQGELTLDQASMDGIKAWVRKNPHRLQELLAVNPSYIFFRTLPPSQDGPIGALNVPLTPERSLAVDKRFIPLGAPVFLSTTYPNRSETLQRLMLAQDTGSAITGVVRGDFFWGFGPAAGAEAGKMRQQGEMWVLLPRGYTPE
jgi:membrane-bound lytic murein transglycosylase A